MTLETLLSSLQSQTLLKNGVTGVTGVQPNEYAGCSVTPAFFAGVTGVTPGAAHAESVTPVTPADFDGVTAKAAPFVACTPVTPVTPEKNISGEKREAEAPSAAPPFIPNPGPRLPVADRWRFVIDSPFTRALLERATELWDDPLSFDDWQDVHEGKYLYERRSAALANYLRQWAKNHPDRMAHLLGRLNGDPDVRIREPLGPDEPLVQQPDVPHGA